MNCTPSPCPSPPMGERASVGRVRGIAIGSRSQCIRECGRGLSMNLSVLPASCRQKHRSKALPTRRRKHLVGGIVSPVRGSWSDRKRFMVPMQSKKRKELSKNRKVLPASCRQRDRRKALPTRRRHHPEPVAVQRLNSASLLLATQRMLCANSRR
jgi:hypothetical protein